MFCSKCGTSNSDDDKNCVKCGESLNNKVVKIDTDLLKKKGMKTANKAKDAASEQWKKAESKLGRKIAVCIASLVIIFVVFLGYKVYVANSPECFVRDRIAFMVEAINYEDPLANKDKIIKEFVHYDAEDDMRDFISHYSLEPKLLRDKLRGIFYRQLGGEVSPDIAASDFKIIASGKSNHFGRRRWYFAVENTNPPNKNLVGYLFIVGKYKGEYKLDVWAPVGNKGRLENLADQINSGHYPTGFE